MSQLFKSLYFADGGRKKSLSLAFGTKDQEIFTWVHTLCSQDIRDIIGHESLASLQRSAETEGLSPGTYCLSRLRRFWKEHQQKNNADADTSCLEESEIGLHIDPIQATFRGGIQEPLHNWYPYLEGYSSKFVEAVLARYAPSAEHILDPFGGTGTTPITVAQQGKRGVFAELNPLLQTITKAKVSALRMQPDQRKELAKRLLTVAEAFTETLLSFKPDSALAQNYKAVFGESVFFSETTADEILRARAYVDFLHRTSPVDSIFVQIAILSSLVPSSYLIRRGDLRFKTPEERKRTDIFFTHSVSAYLRCIANDIEDVDVIPGSVELLCEDARNIGRVPPLDVDAVVTSPPYLNGTNYFRNTKLELWFLRVLRTKQDLADFRWRAVTSGINDVTVGKSRQEGGDNPRLSGVVSLLEGDAYDRRIPQMVVAYYKDMEAVFAAIKPHLAPDARFIVDIGDSAYGSVHVPTDKFISDVARDADLVPEDEIVLRKRLSRGGFELRQVLLVFRNRRRPQRVVREAGETIHGAEEAWNEQWTHFKKELPHQSGEFAKRNWGHPLHSLCSYQGKMKPSLAASLVRTFVPTGGTILDPFGGVGTIPFEAALYGCNSWCFDISPAALHIATAKLTKPDAESCHQYIDALAEALAEGVVSEEEYEQAEGIRFNGSLDNYFNAETFREILLARRFFQMNPPHSGSESLVLASLLHILHGNRPYALSRRSHPITPFAPTGDAEYRSLITRLKDKVGRSLAVEYPENFREGRALYQDATSWWPQRVNDIDAVITSPPFYDSTRFYLANWMRLWFCGWEARDFQSEPLAFVDERQKASFEIYESIFRQARERLKPGGVMVLHLGESRKCNMAEILAHVARKWFRVKDRFSENVLHCESHGIRDKGTVTAHQYLVLG